MSRSYIEIDKVNKVTTTITTTNSAGFGYVPANMKNLSYAQNTAGNWFSDTVIPFPFYITLDFSFAVEVDRLMFLTNSQFGNGGLRTGSIEYSDDNSSWTNATSFTDLGGAGVIDTRWQVIDFTLASHRYWRIKIDSMWVGGTRLCCSKIIMLNTAELGSDLIAGATLLSALNTGGQTLSRFNDGIIEAGGSYAYIGNTPYNNFCLDLGSLQYVDQILLAEYVSALLPGIVNVYINTANTYSTWQLVESHSWTDDGFADNVDYMFFDFKLRKKYLTRYIRFDFDATLSVNPNLAFAGYELLMFSAGTPTAPSTPIITSITQHINEVGLAWSWATGVDNLIADDIVFDIQRNLNGGAFSTIATGLEDTFYTDLTAPTGTVSYKVKARNKFHLVESAYVTTIDITTPASSGGGESIHISAS